MRTPIHLLSEGRETLRMLAERRSLLAFDFDGTLAPIVAERGDAGMGERTRALLRSAAALFPCAVISGRARADLAARLAGIPGLYLAGNHGAEDGDGPPPAAVRAQVRSWANALREAAWGEGIEIEEKGFSLSVHYRGAPSPEQARRRILHLASALPGARVFGGHAVVNLAPLGAPNKAYAVARFASRLTGGPVLYVGDDDTDEDAFRSAVVTHPVRVGRSESTAARYCLEEQGEIDGLLWCLVSERAREAGLDGRWQELDPARNFGGAE